MDIDINISKRIIAIITAFTSEILISTVCFKLLYEAYSYDNLYTIAIGFVIGVGIFTLVDAIINKLVLKNMKKYNID